MSFQKEKETTIILSERDAELVFSLIENPPPPNEKLKAAAAKHRQFFQNQKTQRGEGAKHSDLKIYDF